MFQTKAAHQMMGGFFMSTCQRSNGLLLQHFQEMLAELGHLRCDHCHAVRLVGIVGKVFLVVFLRHVELVQLFHLSDDGMVPDLLGVQIFDELLGSLLLLIVMVEDGGAVLGAHIRALAIERGGIMNGEENVQQILVGDKTRVKVDLHHLGMPSVAAADFAVRRVWHTSASVA